MSTTIGRYHADEKLAELLKAAAEAHAPLEIVTEERTYELDVRGPDRSRDIWRDYDAEAALRSVRESPHETEPVDRRALTELIAEIRALTLVTNNDADYRDVPDLKVLPAQITP